MLHASMADERIMNVMMSSKRKRELVEAIDRASSDGNDEWASVMVRHLATVSTVALREEAR